MSKPMVTVVIPEEKAGDADALIDDIHGHQDYDGAIETIARVGEGGPSRGRNEGLAGAHGDYVIFCDADDHPKPNYISSLTEAVQSAPDVVMAGCGYDVCEEPGDKGQGSQNDIMKSVIKTCDDEKVQMSTEDMLFRLFDTKVYQGYIWNKIFKNDAIKKAGLRFSEDVRYNEDRLFIFNYLLMNPGQVVYTNDVGYRYVIRDGSAMGELRRDSRVTDIMTTEFLAFDMMIAQLEALLLDGLSPGIGAGGKNASPMGLSTSTIGRLINEIRQDEIQSELRLFKKMVGRSDIFAYRKSAMRRYAKACPDKLYIPHGPMEDVLLRILKRYGWSGCTYTSHPEYFEGVGILGD